jgi:hypothetical protein
MNSMVIEWRRTATGWRARGVYALGDGDHAATVETWVQAERLCPALTTSRDRTTGCQSWRGPAQPPGLQICRGDLSYFKTSLQTSDRSRLAAVRVSRLGASAAGTPTQISPAPPIRPTLLVY